MISGPRGMTPRAALVHGARSLLHATAYLVSSLGAGLYALLLLSLIAVVALSSLVGIGLVLAGPAAELVQRWSNRERARTGRFLGHRIGPLYVSRSRATVRTLLRDELAKASLRRDLRLLVVRVVSIPLGLLVVIMPLMALNALVIAVYWWAVPGTTDQFFPVTSWWDASASALIGLLGLAMWGVLVIIGSRTDAKIAERLLAPSREQELWLRAHLEEGRRRSATDSHTAELRRIERDLHDAAQNRLVAVSMYVGTAQRQLTTGKGEIAQSLSKAQEASRDALAEMRRIIRGIYPPTLAEEGLVPALGLLVDRMQIPTRLHVGSPSPTPASVDAALYFSIAESLTNVVKHSHATECEVHVQWETDHGESRVVATVTDDGRGGAEESRGSGLTGVRQRIVALGGAVSMTSPPGGPTTLRMELLCESS